MERQTRQREAIHEAFVEAARPLSAQEAHALAGKRVRALGIATVYRNIKSFVEEGMLVAVELPGESPRYELAGKEHHHHFHCRTCGRVYDIAGCAEALTRRVPRGFRVDSHEVVLYGRCGACA